MERRLARGVQKDSDGRLLLAGGVIYDDKRRVLLIHRATPSLTQWETPGGKLDAGESPEQTAVRELREELGIHAEIIADLGSHDLDSGPHRLRYALFEMRVVEGSLHILEPQTFDEFRFFTLQELADIRDELSVNAANFLELQLHGKT